MNGDKNIKFTKVDEKRLEKRKKQKEIQKGIYLMDEYEEGKVRVSTNLPISVADALIYYTKTESAKENSRSELLENIILDWTKENISEELLKEG
ncbi:TPA: hypothetical protein RQA65_003512 [Clostridioides difficile]|nr:hypothetical protein [Clostridioides difficile]